MDSQFQQWLSELAGCADAKMEFSEGSPVRVHGMVDDELNEISVSLDQPEGDLVFNILCAIGHFAVLKQYSRSWPFPRWLNRPYEIEFMGEVTFKARRAVKQKLHLNWQSELWAMGIYCQLGRHKEFGYFLKRHPEKMKLLLLIWCGYVCKPSLRQFKTCCKIIRCVIAAKFAVKNA